MVVPSAPEENSALTGQPDHQIEEVLIAGPGRVGGGLGELFGRAGLSVQLWSPRRDEAPPLPSAPGRVVLIAVRDEAISGVCERLSARGELDTARAVLHCSGAHPAGELLAAASLATAIGTLHPLVAVNEREHAARRLSGATFALEGERPALEVGRELVGRIGARCFELRAGQLPLYHAAAVLASNHAVILWTAAQSLLEKIGLPPSEVVAALIPLLQSTVDNVGERGLPRALTGPLRRGDAQTIARHLDELAAMAPAELALYLACTEAGLQQLEVAAGSEDLPSAVDRQRIRALVERIRRRQM